VRAPHQGCRPAGRRGAVQYGPRVAAVIVYLYAGQFLPQGRTAQALAELFGIPLSAGTVAGITARAAGRLGGSWSTPVTRLPPVTWPGSMRQDSGSWAGWPGSALAAQVRLYRSAVLGGASQTAARSGVLMKKHNALARRLRDRQDDYLRFTADFRAAAR